MMILTINYNIMEYGDRLKNLITKFFFGCCHHHLNFIRIITSYEWMHVDTALPKIGNNLLSTAKQFNNELSAMKKREIFSL